MPLIIYAKVNYGPYPVFNADVKALVTSPEGVKTEIQLLDDGVGDPDITKNDGIYSRYFTQIDSEGDYKVIVTANDNKGQAAYGKNGRTSCCGSNIPLEADATAPLQWSYQTIFRAISKKPEEGYRPSRILDLKVDKLDLPNSVTLKWTAPGGEMSNAQAHTYLLRAHTSLTDIFEQLNETSLNVNIDIQPKQFSKQQSFEVKLEEFEKNTTYFFVLLSKNSVGLLSDLSNAVTVYLTKDKDTTDTIDVEDENSKQNGMDSATIGLIVGLAILFVIVILIIYVIVYFVCVRPKRKKESTYSRNNKTVLPSKSPFETNSIPADVILKHHNEVVHAKNMHKDPPIFKEENIEMLHDRSKSSENNAPNFGTVYELPDKRKTADSQDTTLPRAPKKMTVV